MATVLVEDRENGKKAYESIIVDPKSLGILTNELSLKIIQGLARAPGCALDLARSLKEHEQKIYYHMRKLEEAGIIRFLREEKRLGMTAKIYDAVSPVVATKLYEDGFAFTGPMKDLHLAKFLKPFIEEGKLNATIVVGDPYPHGRFEVGAKSSVHLFDFALHLGQLLTTMTFPHYSLDVHMDEKRLHDNLIIVGNPQENMVFDKINSNKLPVFFNEKDDWSITSAATGKSYGDPRDGFFLKWKNPLNPDSLLLLFGGKRTRGLQSAMICFTRHFEEMLKESPKMIGAIVQGYDKDSDSVIDAVRVLERIEV